ncbi:putative alkaline shock family protein YloU [Actinomycetospora succinea]|uniref:Putative alkaline shock family protein YloU n=1 Tax=Actinomycetospora succinea TaxID=663603 RepID=A0A4R6VEH7_9PSEU|nr:Asp23/Gls24 family envelope stress response protein [Actinomycetospora succinea]TDQ60761.1 putative alkaline shock family protein YloU [Actinomycetospora succinea]
MTSAQRPSSTPSSPTPTATSVPGAAGDPTTVEGTTEVLPSVIQKVTAFSAREIPGVVALGGSTSRAVGAVRQTLTGNTENTAGVRVELADQKAHIGLDVEIEYGVGARELVRALRRHVPKAVEEIAGVTVVELNIVITDVHLPGADVDSDADPVAPPAATL